jgi:hypothetical protein
MPTGARSCIQDAGSSNLGLPIIKMKENPIDD